MSIRAAVLPAPDQKIELREYPEPELAPGGVLLKTEFSEVCGTDVHLQDGHLQGVPYPIIPGHVSVGRIEKMRGTVKDEHGQPFKEGDQVGFMDVVGSCGKCWYCQVAKASTRCPERKVYGITMPADGLFGGWADKILLRPDVQLLRFPEGLTAEDYIGGGCGLNTAFHAVERAQIRLGDIVLVQGAGPVGLSCAAFATLSGAHEVWMIGAPSKRLEFGRKMGVDRSWDLASTTLEARREEILSRTHGRGPDIVIEATGNPKAIPEGLDLVRDQGRYVVVGHYTDAGEIPINPHTQINRKHVEIRGSWGSDFSHFYRSIQVQAKHKDRFLWREMADRTYSLDDAQKALDAVRAQEVVKALIRPV
ncbi:MAG: zinc-binding dehydrogenase [Planctomycetota bacterium]